MKYLFYWLRNVPVEQYLFGLITRPVVTWRLLWLDWQFRKGMEKEKK